MPPVKQLSCESALINDDSVEYWLAQLGDAIPLNVTKPTPGAPNELAAVELVAKMLRTPLLPWQRYVARVATELNEDGSYRYGTILLTVPRQSGKTTLFRSILTARCLKKKNRRSFTSAQTGKDARERLFDLADIVALSAIGKTVRIRRAAEAPRIEFKNLSRLQSFPPTPESLHGYVIYDCVLDEIFAFDEVSGNLLLGAIIPAQSTIKDRQLLMCSTMGTPDSVFLNQWIDKGRKSVESTTTGLAYFEWGLEDGLDPFDEDNWDWHPGLAGGLITKDDILAAAEGLTSGQFIRAYMNRLTLTAESLFDMDKFEQGMAELTIPRRKDVAIGWEVNADRSRAAIVAAWREGNKYQVKVIRNGYGTAWLPNALEDIYKGRPLVIGADKHPQNLVIMSDMQTSHPDVESTILSTEGFKTGCVAFKAGIEDTRVQHNGHISLKLALGSATSRKMGESWVVTHKSDPELIAAIVACRLLDEIKPESTPMFFIGD